MTIYATGNANIEAVLQAVTTGLVGTLRISIVDTPNSAVYLAPTTSGIYENPAGGAIYAWSGVAPNQAGQYTVVWDNGTNNGVLGVEDLVVTQSTFTGGSATGIDLCTVADVKNELEISADTTRDDTIQTVISGVSRAIHQMIEREFKTETTGSTTRRFEVRSGGTLVDLAPYDLHSASGLTVTLHPEASTPVTLAATSEYRLVPTQPKWTYQAIHISPQVAQLHVSETARRFGVSLVDVTSASWGFASVPADVKRAAIISVAANLDRRLDAYALAANDLVDMDAGVQPVRQMAFSIPMAALVLLNPYRRSAGVF